MAEFQGSNDSESFQKLIHFKQSCFDSVSLYRYLVVHFSRFIKNLSQPIRKKVVSRGAMTTTHLQISRMNSVCHVWVVRTIFLRSSGHLSAILPFLRPFWATIGKKSCGTRIHSIYWEVIIFLVHTLLGEATNSCIDSMQYEKDASRGKPTTELNPREPNTGDILRSKLLLLLSLLKEYWCIGVASLQTVFFLWN